MSYRGAVLWLQRPPSAAEGCRAVLLKPQRLSVVLCHIQVFEIPVIHAPENVGGPHRDEPPHLGVDARYPENLDLASLGVIVHLARLPRPDLPQHVRAGGGAAVAGEVFVPLFEAFPVVRGAIPAGGVDLDVRVVPTVVYVYMVYIGCLEVCVWCMYMYNGCT